MDKATKFLTLVLALFAVIQFYGYISDERAIVYAEGVALPNGLGGIDPLPMQLKIRNGGKRVATIKEVAASITHTLPPEPRYANAPKFAFPPAVSGGIVKRPLKFNATGGYTGDNLARLKNGALKLYLLALSVTPMRSISPKYLASRKPDFASCMRPSVTNMDLRLAANPPTLSRIRFIARREGQVLHYHFSHIGLSRISP